MLESIAYTIGTALQRARDHHLPVEVLVEGQWLGGTIGALDGHGLVLENAGDHSIVRLGFIAAVRVLSPSPLVEPFVPSPRIDSDEGRHRL